MTNYFPLRYQIASLPLAMTTKPDIVSVRRLVKVELKVIASAARQSYFASHRNANAYSVRHCEPSFLLGAAILFH